MDVISSQVRTESTEYRSNRTRMLALVAELKARHDEVRQGGGREYLERHRQQGKLPVRERIDQLLDARTPFLELSALAALRGDFAALKRELVEEAARSMGSSARRLEASLATLARLEKEIERLGPGDAARRSELVERFNAQREDARRIIRDAVGGDDETVVIFAGSGCTGAIDKLIGILGLRVPSGFEDRWHASALVPGEVRPVIFIGP